MSIPFNEASIPGRHTIRYRVRDDHKKNPVRDVEVLATPEEIKTLVSDGYLVRERLVPMEHIEYLRAAFDEIVAREDIPGRGGSKQFGGVFSPTRSRRCSPGRRAWTHCSTWTTWMTGTGLSASSRARTIGSRRTSRPRTSKRSPAR